MGVPGVSLSQLDFPLLIESSCLPAEKRRQAYTTRRGSTQDIHMTFHHFALLSFIKSSGLLTRQAEKAGVGVRGTRWGGGGMRGGGEWTKTKNIIAFSSSFLS